MVEQHRAGSSGWELDERAANSYLSYPLFDCHMHIIDPRFPLVPNQGYLPPTFTVDDYRARTSHLNIVGGAVVSGSFQGFDQAYLVDALSRLGPGFVGVTQLPSSVDDDQIRSLDAAGVRAVRFNLYRGQVEDLDRLKSLALRAFAIAGWHVELYVDSRDLADLAAWVLELPRVSIDHLGLSREGFGTLLKLVERGVRVKATGFGRSDLDIPSALRDICSVDPSALMFGTDLPSTRARRPFQDSDIVLILDVLGEEHGRRALHDNAATFYGRYGRVDNALR